MLWSTDEFAGPLGIVWIMKNGHYIMRLEDRSWKIRSWKEGKSEWVSFMLTSTYHSLAHQNCPHNHCHGHKPKILECTAGCHSDTHSQSKVLVLWAHTWKLWAPHSTYLRGNGWFNALLTTISLIRSISAVIVPITLPANGHTAVVITAEISQRVTGQLICMEQNAEVDFHLFHKCSKVN